MHLTNYSINKHSEDYIESDDILAPNNATKRTKYNNLVSFDYFM